MKLLDSPRDIKIAAADDGARTWPMLVCGTDAYGKAKTDSVPMTAEDMVSALRTGLLKARDVPGVARRYVLAALVEALATADAALYNALRDQ